MCFRKRNGYRHPDHFNAKIVSMVVEECLYVTEAFQFASGWWVFEKVRDFLENRVVLGLLYPHQH